MRRENPMPVTGALLLTNPRKHRAGSVSSIMARLNRSKRRKAGRKSASRVARARSMPRTSKGRFTKRRNMRTSKPGLKAFGALAVRSNARKKNPFAVVRRNGAFGAFAVRTNGVVSMASSLVKKVPFVGSSVAPLIAPAVTGAAAMAVVHYSMQYGLPLVMQFAPMVPVVGPLLVGTVLPMIAPIGYTVGGAVVGAALVKLPVPFVSPSTKKALAVGAVVGGAAVDILRFLSADSAPAAPAVSGLHGGLWQSVPFADLSVGGRTYGESGVAAIEADYADARMSDAQRCPDDFDQMEGPIAMMGADAWRRAFHPIRVTDRSGAELAFSRHAGREGHRWAWLVRMIGFDRFVKLAKLPAWQRQSYIRQLKQRAISADSLQQSELHGLILAQ